MESVVKTDVKGRKKVLNACTELCSIEKNAIYRWQMDRIHHLSPKR